MIRLLHSLPVLYLVMLWPAIEPIRGLSGDWYYPQMMYETGVWSVRFLVLALAVTPLLALISRVGAGRALGKWLLPRRRHFGLASFVYAVLHLTHYVLYTSDLDVVAIEFLQVEYFTGWLAFAIFLALAMTSNNWAIRKMGRNWKRLHLWVYPSTGAVFLHWYLFGLFFDQMMFWVAVIVGIKLAHVALKVIAKRARATKTA